METRLSVLKQILREDDIPFFNDSTLLFYLSMNNNDLNYTAYQCLLIKAEETTLQLTGLTTADTSKYFRRLALRYRPTNSGVLG